MNQYAIILFFFLSSVSFISAQGLSATDLIEKSIQYHDPNGVWEQFQDTMSFSQKSPNMTRHRTAYLDRTTNNFSFNAKYDDGTLQYNVISDRGEALWNDSESIPDSTRAKYRISSERAVMYRNYYSYLYGMPMKLHDPGVKIHPEVEESYFFGRDYYKITVSYEVLVGTDTWSFYFDKDNYALGAYEFYKKELGDGEYILLDGEKIIDGIKLPQEMAWYVSKDDRWLGTDILE